MTKYLWELQCGVDDIAGSGSRVGKADELLYYLENVKLGADFRELLYFTYSPALAFGAKRLPPGSPAGEGIPLTRMFRALSRLSRREFAGGAAKEALKELTLLARDAAEQELLERILRKNLYLGLTARSINKITAAFGVSFKISIFEVMLAAKDLKKLVYPSYVEPKLDGVRIIAEIDAKGGVKLISRSGQNLTKRFPKVQRSLEELTRKAPNALTSTYLEGELIAEEGFRALTSRVQGKGVVKDTLTITYVIFDALTALEFAGEIRTPLRLRKEKPLWTALQVGGYANVQVLAATIVQDKVVLLRQYEKCLAAGYEGVVVKDAEGRYEPKRSNAWIKMKPFETFDFVVFEIEEGQDLYAGMTGALVVCHLGKEVKVGTGMTRLERAAWWKKPSLIIGKTIEVRTQEIIESSTLKPFVFLRMREDKE